jgi:hypothetical protein
VSDVVRIGAVATLDPDAEHELGVWREDLPRGLIDDPSETRARLDAYGRGEWVIARLDLFALALTGDRVIRYAVGSVPGCWFEVGSEPQNTSHAREMVASHLELICDQMRKQGIDAALPALERADIAIEFDGPLEAKLRRTQEPQGRA